LQRPIVAVKQLMKALSNSNKATTWMEKELALNIHYSSLEEN